MTVRVKRSVNSRFLKPSQWTFRSCIFLKHKQIHSTLSIKACFLCFNFFVYLYLIWGCMLRRVLLLCVDERPCVLYPPGLRVKINPLKTPQILAPCSATLGHTTGGNYTFRFLFSHQTAYCPGKEHTHAAQKIQCKQCCVSIITSVRYSTAAGWKCYLCTGRSYSTIAQPSKLHCKAELVGTAPHANTFHCQLG